ncbi:MAG: hypothetical protein ACSNEK_08370 [Parachlamydiaceae bacterium]
MAKFIILSQQVWGISITIGKTINKSSISLCFPKKAMESQKARSEDQLYNLHYLIHDTALQPNQEPQGLIAASLSDYRGDDDMGTRKNKTASIGEDEKVNPAIEDFAETFIKNLKDHPVNDLESFEARAKKIAEGIFTSSKLFKKRFEKGYRAILEELKHQNQP